MSAPPTPPAMQSPQQQFMQRFGPLADRVVGNNPPPDVAAARFAAGSPTLQAPSAAHQALQNLQNAIQKPAAVQFPVTTVSPSVAQGLAAMITVHQQDRQNPTGPANQYLFQNQPFKTQQYASEDARLQQLRKQAGQKPRPLDDFLGGFR